MSALVLVVLAGCEGPQGPAGPAGEAGAPGAQGLPGNDGQDGSDGTIQPSINGVFPFEAFAGREADVLISGNGTDWTSAVAVDFGGDIGVSDITLASPTAIRAHLVLDGTAAIGRRDLSVTEGSQTLTFADAFEVKPSIALETGSWGTWQQGGMGNARIVLLEPSVPFAHGADVSIEGGVVLVDNVADDVIRFEYALDAFATPGVVTLDSGGIVTEFPFTPVANPPVPLVAGTNTVHLADAYVATVFEANDVVPRHWVVTNQTSGNDMWMLGADGTWGSWATVDDENDTWTFETNGTDPVYVVFLDDEGGSGFDVDIDVAIMDPPVPEIEPNNGCASAQTVTLPGLVDGEIATGNDKDWYAFDVPAADVGKVVHVTTSGGDNIDAIIDVLASDCTTSLGGPFDHHVTYEDAISDPTTTAGTHYAKITLYNSGSPGLYQMSIALE